MENLIVIFVVALILGTAIYYIRREKKKGTKCIGCPAAAGCAGKCAGCACSCSGHTK